MGTFTSVLNLFKPATSDFIDVVADLNDNTDKLETLFGPLLTSWQTFTPTWTSDGSAPSIGNGSMAGRYKQIGKTVFFNMSITFGSTTSFGSGAYFWSGPVPAKIGAGPAATNPFVLTGVMTDAAVANYAFVGGYFNTATQYNIQCISSITNRQSFAIGSTQPFTWGNGDQIFTAGIYEAA
jgi:hypothetical protein